MVCIKRLLGTRVSGGHGVGSSAFDLSRGETYGYDNSLDYLTTAHYGDKLAGADKTYLYDAAGNQMTTGISPSLVKLCMVRMIILALFFGVKDSFLTLAFLVLSTHLQEQSKMDRDRNGGQTPPCPIWPGLSAERANRNKYWRK